jgi:hypothetical protein
LCGEQYQVANQDFVTEDDDNPDTPTKIFIAWLAYCAKPGCGNYHGGEFGNPAKAVDTIRNQVK